jgi:hypothetical protein
MMKKVFYTAILLIAFSINSFANPQKEINKEVNELPKSEIVSNTLSENQPLEDGCFTVVYRWAEGQGDGQGGMILTFHRVEFELCFF